MRKNPPRAALVTGGSRRIGRAISLALGRVGYAVAVHGREPSRDADELVRTLASNGVAAGFVPADLADSEALEGLVARAAAAVGPLTLLVNNASVFEDDAVGRLAPTRWNRHLAVNLTAPVLLAQNFAAQAPEGADAAIINITDQRAHKPVPRHFSYTLTKCALDVATVMLAQALAPRVRVNAVAPGPTLPSPRQDPQGFARQQAAVPLGRGPTPEDIAAAVLYLASASAITGESIAVDGGQHIAWMTPDATGADE